jgi:predicted  nucleic acid-binding Zn-ribbon protein
VGKRIRVSGTVKSVSDEVAMVQLDRDAPVSLNALMIDAGAQFGGLPLDAFLTPGMKLGGEWEEGSSRFHPDLGDWSEQRVLEEYPVGTVVLGMVASVSRQVADVRIHPSFSIEMKRDEVSTNPKDVIDHLWKKGDIVNVRVVRGPSGGVRLRHHDVDDDEPIAPAPAIIDGGEPWLTISKMDLIESTKELWERERQEAEALTNALEVLAETMRVDKAKLESMFGSLGTDTGEIPVVASSTSDLTAKERSLNEFTAAQIRRMITNYQVELGKLTERNRRLSEALAAGTRREADLAAENDNVRKQLSKARQELQDLQKLTHTGVAEASIADRRARFWNTEDWILEEMRRFWIDNYTPSDRKQFAFDRIEWRILPSFCETFEKLTEDGMDKAIRAATHIVTGRQAADNMFESHPLREGDESSKPPVVRDDGAMANRAYIESHTSQARRLHYWKLKDGSIELSRVGLHDDFTP